MWKARGFEREVSGGGGEEMAGQGAREVRG